MQVPGHATPNWLEQAAASRPADLAVADREHRLTYAELLDAARRLAAVRDLEGAGHVEIAARPGVDFAVEMHAAILAGRAFEPLAPSNVPGRAPCTRVRDVGRGEGGSDALAVVLTIENSFSVFPRSQ